MIKHLSLLAPIVAWVASVSLAAADPTVRIPFMVGLTTVVSVTDALGDHENIEQVSSITPEAFVLTRSADAVPQENGGKLDLQIKRRVLAVDQRSSRTFRGYFHTADPLEFPGTTVQASALMVNELRTNGHTTVTRLEIAPERGATVIKRRLTGSLATVEPAPVPVSMLVNGQRTSLPAWHVRGHLVQGEGGDDVELYVLDDPANALILRAKGSRFASTMTRIEFPRPEGQASSIGESLQKQERAVVYGIYFSFASATIRPESDAVLKEIAELMRKNPDWRLRIDGHTDSIGGDPSNLDLSRRRSAAVKTALVARFGIAEQRLVTGGYGAGQPQEKNDTPEGRARNRRVELMRSK